MAKKGVSLPTAYQHPRTGKKPPRNNAALWLCLCLLVVFATLIAGCTTDTRGRPGVAGAPGTPGAPGSPGNMTMNLTANMTAGPPGGTGPIGVNGTPGVPGIQGIQGIQGVAGATGPMGPENLTAINNSYYLRDTSLSLNPGTSDANLFRNTTAGSTIVRGGTMTAGSGGVIQMAGKDLMPDAILFYVPDTTTSIDQLVATFVGQVSPPYLDMEMHQIKRLLNPTDAQDATTLAYEDARPVINSSYVTNTLDVVWSPWTPGLNWTNGTPSGITTIARYNKVGKIIHFTIDISSADSNWCSNLNITLPVPPANNGNRIPVTTIQMVGV
jgi:hypothetical protein